MPRMNRSSRCREKRVKLVLDMETQDPDDFLNLLFLASHPLVDLRAVTLVPGTPEQAGLVVWALGELGYQRGEVRIGVSEMAQRKRRGGALNPWHTRVYGEHPPYHDAESAREVLMEVCDKDTTLVTGGPPFTLGRTVWDTGFKLGRWIAQGGFAGVGVVPPELPTLEKFQGLETCPTFNFSGAWNEALTALESERILEKRCVSKNVCHQVLIGADEVDLLVDAASRTEDARHRRGLELIAKGAAAYVARRGAKKAHDLVAGAAAIDPSFLTWAEHVVVYRAASGRWGSRPGGADDKTSISVGVDHERFRALLCGGV